MKTENSTNSEPLLHVASSDKLVELLIGNLDQAEQLASSELLSQYRRLLSRYEKLLNPLSGTVSDDSSPRRNLLSAESAIADKRLPCPQADISPLPAIHEPDCSREVKSPVFIKSPSSETIAYFQSHLSRAERFETEVSLLERAVLMPGFLAPNVSSSIMNTFLQDGDVQIDEHGRVQMDQLLAAWEGQKLTFRVSRSGTMTPVNSDDPSEMAFYKLETRHTVFKTVAEELASVFRLLYGTDEERSEIYSVSLSMRYLVADKGGNEIHVDAWKDTTLSQGMLYTNQQFSLFLSVDESEEFIVFSEDGSGTRQQGEGSLMGFNPTQRHHHPDGHGSWILIIEVLKSQSLA